MEVKIVVPLSAQMIDGYYNQLDQQEMYKVKEICMGQTSTSVSLENAEGCFNSIHFKFYIGSREVDIYKSGLFNPYITFSKNPAVAYVGGSFMTQEQLSDLHTFVKSYGDESQVDMCLEELAELNSACSDLQKVLLKYRRKARGWHSKDVEIKKAEEDIIDELADVSIMVEQMKIIYGRDAVEERIAFKINRQMDRLRNGGAGNADNAGER